MKKINVMDERRKRFVSIVESLELIDRLYGITRAEREAIEAMRGNFFIIEDD